MIEICFVVIAILQGLIDLALGQPNIYIAEATTGQRCIIPFVYKGKVYHDCSNEDSDSPWCYVNKEFTHWEYCKPRPKEYDGCEILIPSVTVEEVEEILRVHNKFRSKIPALRMRKLEWNSELAQRAQLAADRCMFRYTDRTLCGFRDKIGQNLFYKYTRNYWPELTSWTSVISQWSEQEKNYDYDNNRCRSECDDYITLAWASTNLVGCGRAYCSVYIENGLSNSIQYFCNYYQSSIELHKPFIKSNETKCQDCHLFNGYDKFRCNEDQLCETCDSSMKGCKGLEDVCKDTSTDCKENSDLCNAVKINNVPFPEIFRYINSCKWTCGLCKRLLK